MQTQTQQSIERVQYFLDAAEREQQNPLHYYELAQSLFDILPDIRTLLAHQASEKLEFKRSFLEVAA